MPIVKHANLKISNGISERYLEKIKFIFVELTVKKKKNEEINTKTLDNFISTQ